MVLKIYTARTKLASYYKLREIKISKLCPWTLNHYLESSPRSNLNPIISCLLLSNNFLDIYDLHVEKSESRFHKLPIIRLEFIKSVFLPLKNHHILYCTNLLLIQITNIFNLQLQISKKTNFSNSRSLSWPSSFLLLFNQFGGSKSLTEKNRKVTSFPSVLRWIKRAFVSFRIVKPSFFLGNPSFLVFNLTPIAANERESSFTRITKIKGWTSILLKLGLLLLVFAILIHDKKRWLLGEILYHTEEIGIDIDD